MAALLAQVLQQAPVAGVDDRHDPQPGRLANSSRRRTPPGSAAPPRLAPRKSDGSDLPAAPAPGIGPAGLSLRMPRRRSWCVVRSLPAYISPASSPG
jgi:hypothetical protein